VISFFIGPEGGFDPKEIDIADKAGVRTVTLGRRILRTETAGLAVLSMLIYRLERL
jgi:16S rRNA (uracil1498-N3)-methyltransferase